jgi:HD-GYP domain-containing protein (c-di-GMP phosphodiesterase class II)
LLPIVRQHHERFGGSGYPDGLSGQQICMGARVIAVADSFDAMTSNRTYRKGMRFERAINELIAGKGGQFDSQVVDALNEMVERMGIDAFEQAYRVQNFELGES